MLYSLVRMSTEMVFTFPNPCTDTLVVFWPVLVICVATSHVVFTYINFRSDLQVEENEFNRSSVVLFSQITVVMRQGRECKACRCRIC